MVKLLSMDKLVLDKLAKEVVSDILSSGKDTVSIEEYCNRKLEETHKDLSDLQIAETLQLLVEKAKLIFDKTNEEKVSRGIKPEYERQEYPEDMLMRYDIIHEENGLSYVRKYRKEILITICRMDWRDFQFLCKHLLGINKIVISDVTCGSKEGGVDFYGLLQMERFNPGLLLKNAKIRIIGQAKRYKNVVEHDEIRTFKTQQDDLLQNTGNAINKLPSWFVRSKDPLLSIFVATTRFSRGAKTYAKQNSILLRDGEQVIEDLIKSPHAREWFFRKDGKLTFDKVLFTKFFENERKCRSTS
jgi:hypothetical protein